MRRLIELLPAAACLKCLALVTVVFVGCERKTQSSSATVSRTIGAPEQPLDAADSLQPGGEPQEAASLYTVAKYDPARDPAKDLAETIRIAQDSKKRILLQVGGEWCGWCHKLDGYIAEHAAVSSAIDESFVIMKVNYGEDNKNEAFLAQYPTIPGYPHLYVLESDGTLLHSQNTVELEEGSSYNEATLLAFVQRWKVKLARRGTSNTELRIGRLNYSRQMPQHDCQLGNRNMFEAMILLGLAALGGLTMAAIRIRGAPWPPMWLALVHGTVAAIGVGVLIYFALTTGIPTLALAALVIFILAALGGATLFLGFHLRNKPLPIPFVIGHGLIAVTGFALLLWSWLNAS